MRRIREREAEIATKLLEAIRNKDLKLTELLYDEVAEEKIRCGADHYEMVSFGIAKALTLDKLERAIRDDATYKIN